MQNSHRRSIHLGILNVYGFQNNIKKYDKFNYKIRSSFYILLLNRSKGFLCPQRSHRGQWPNPIIIISTREMNYHLHARPLFLREKYSQYSLQRSVVETQRFLNPAKEKPSYATGKSDHDYSFAPYVTCHYTFYFAVVF